MVGRIAGRYDLANRLLSGGIDVWWRKKLIRAVARDAPADVLDLATGSGDVAFALADGLPAETPITGRQPQASISMRRGTPAMTPPTTPKTSASPEATAN